MPRRGEEVAMSTRTRTVGAVAVFALGWIFAGTASAKTITVKDGGNLQAAIDGAAAGDTIVVKKGTYAPVALTGRADLKIRGVGKAVVDGAAASNCLQLTNCQRIVVTGLTLKDSQLSGILATTCDAVTIRSCTVLNAGDEGIEFSSCENTVIDKNTIDKTGDDGIAVSDGSGDQSNHSKITKNKVKNVPDGGIDVNGSDNLISGNQVRDSKVNGVLVQSGTRNVVEKNKIMTMDGVGIDVRGDGNTVRSNVIQKPTGDGIYVGSNTNVITKNVVTKPGAAGIHVDGGANEVTKNVITKAATFDLKDSSGLTTNTYKANKAKTLDPPTLSNPKK